MADRGMMLGTLASATVLFLMMIIVHGGGFSPQRAFAAEIAGGAIGKTLSRAIKNNRSSTKSNFIMDAPAAICGEGIGIVAQVIPGSAASEATMPGAKGKIAAVPLTHEIALSADRAVAGHASRHVLESVGAIQVAYYKR